MKYISVSEIAKKFNVSRYAVNGWLKKGLFPSAKQLEGVKSGGGNAWLIPESDIENFQKPKRGKPFSANPSDLALAKRRSRANKSPDGANPAKE